MIRFVLAAAIAAIVFAAAGGDETSDAPAKVTRLTATRAAQPELPGAPGAPAPSLDLEAIRPSPLEEPAEDSDSEAAEEPEARAIIEVRNEAGELLTDAYVSVNGGGDGGGRVELAPEPGKSAEALIESRSYSARRTVVLDPGVHTLVLRVGARVAGRVTVDGKAPVRPIDLRLIGRGWFAYLDAETGCDGRFEFRNLARDWIGRLEIPREYRLESATCSTEASAQCPPEFHHWGGPEVLGSKWSLPLAGPDPSLEIRLVEANVISGRIVRDGHGSWRRGVRAEVITANDIRRGFRYRAGSSGEFAFDVPPDAQRVSLEISDIEGLGRRRIELLGPFQGRRDLGDLELGPIRYVLLSVRDDRGQSVEDAVAMVAGIPERCKSDEDGTCEVGVDDQVSELVVGKVGYRPVVVPVPPDESPVEVVLARNGLLRVDVRLADGTIPGQYPSRSALSVRVTCDEPMFEPLPHEAGRLYSYAGGTHWLDDDDLEPRQGRSLECSPEEGRVVVAGLRPGARLTVQLRARGSGLVLDEAAIVAGPDEQALTLRAAGPARTLAGAVTDLEGNLANGATIAVSTESGAFIAELDVRNEGTFKFEGLFEPFVRVLVTRPGCCDLAERVPLSPWTTVRDFALRPLER